MQISFYATLRKIVGTKTIELALPTPCTLQQIVAAVIAAHPALADEILDERGELDRYIHLFVDGRSSKYLEDGLETRVDGRQKIEFFPAVAGG